MTEALNEEVVVVDFMEMAEEISEKSGVALDVVISVLEGESDYLTKLGIIQEPEDDYLAELGIADAVKEEE